MSLQHILQIWQTEKVKQEDFEGNEPGYKFTKRETESCRELRI